MSPFQTAYLSLYVCLSVCLFKVGLPGFRSHLSQVQNETVSLVEALPAHWHLGRPDHTPTFDLHQPLDVNIIGLHMAEPRSHAPALMSEENNKKKNAKRGIFTTAS